MPRWRALPEELDPQVREFTSQLRRLVDRSGLSVSAVADRTGYSRTSWERYLNGRLLPPQGAVVALADVTGTHSGHLTTMWELAERAWSRSEMRHDVTMEAIRVSQARAALGEFGAQPPKAAKGRKARKAQTPEVGAPAQAAAPAAQSPAVDPVAQSQGADRPGPALPANAAGVDGRRGHGGGGGRGTRRQGARRVPMFLAGIAGALAVVAAGVLLLGLNKDDGTEAAEPPPSPTVSKTPELPAGVKCTGKQCEGADPEAMGCGGEYAETVADATVGTAVVEVRYSKVCAAAWSRITKAAPGDEVTVTAAGRTEKRTADADLDAYTAMVVAKSPKAAKACAETQTGLSGCTDSDGAGTGTGTGTGAGTATDQPGAGTGTGTGTDAGTATGN
ncbi:helix-turn-helix domain-containing protein [Streptomyces sp. NPDC048639]|uniref:helix-turn-helix domain-containing protein n=1 Tax=Streptomyces sp. NPDC048639 TaxID=3365581 RepID=UPI003711A05A